MYEQPPGPARDAEHALRAAGLEARRVRAWLARRDVNAFVELVMRDEETGAPLRQAPFHRVWHKLLDRHDRFILWASTESGKTSQAVARVLWEVGRDTSLRVAVLSNTQGQAKKIVKLARRYVEASPEMRLVFPDLRPSDDLWTDNQWTVDRGEYSKDPSVQGLGIHGSIVGSRLDRIVADDLLDPENVRTEEARRDLVDWFKMVLGRLTKRGRVWIIGTAYNPHDIMHVLSADPAWTSRKFPVVAGDGSSRWPEVWPPGRVERARTDLGPLEFARQKLCLAYDPTHARFRSDWVDGAKRLGEGLDVVPEVVEVPEGCGTFTGVDTAVQQHEGAALTAFVTAMALPDGSRRLLSVEAGRWTGPEIVERVIDVHQRYKSIVMIENVGCFPPDAPVLTLGGYRPIGEVAVGDRVLTHTGAWRRVLDTTRRAYSGEVTEIYPSGLPPIVATPKHGILVRRSGRVPGKYPKGGYHRPVGEDLWASACLLRGGENGRAHYVAAPIPRWPKRRPIIRSDRYSKRVPVPVDEAIALFLGLYAAEGSCGNRSQVQLDSHRKELEIRAFEIGVATRLGARATERLHGNAGRVTINSAGLRRVVGEMGRGWTKCLPWSWMGWPIARRLAIVRGWLLGDGCLLENNLGTKWPASLLEGTSCSRALAEQMRFILLAAGFRATLHGEAVRVRAAGFGARGGPLYTVALNAEDTARFLRLCSSTMERARWRPATARERARSNAQVVLEGAVAWAKIRKTGTAAYDGDVCNLVVERDHSYVVGGVAVHNSMDYILQFVRHRSDVPVVPFTTGKQKADPVFGFESLAVELFNGKWLFPSRGGRSHPEVEALCQELLFYSPGQHVGDRAMALWFCREAIRRFSSRRERPKRRVGAVPGWRA